MSAALGAGRLRQQQIVLGRVVIYRCIELGFTYLFGEFGLVFLQVLIAFLLPFALHHYRQTVDHYIEKAAYHGGKQKTENKKEPQIVAQYGNKV